MDKNYNNKDKKDMSFLSLFFPFALLIRFVIFVSFVPFVLLVPYVVLCTPETELYAKLLAD